jgi:hypothetical protein
VDGQLPAPPSVAGVGEEVEKDLPSCSGVDADDDLLRDQREPEPHPLMSRAAELAQAPRSVRSVRRTVAGSRPRAKPSRSLTMVLTRIVSPKMSFRPRLRKSGPASPDFFSRRWAVV